MESTDRIASIRSHLDHLGISLSEREEQYLQQSPEVYGQSFVGWVVQNRLFNAAGRMGDIASHWILPDFRNETETFSGRFEVFRSQVESYSVQVISIPGADHIVVMMQSIQWPGDERQDHTRRRVHAFQQEIDPDGVMNIEWVVNGTRLVLVDEPAPEPINPNPSPSSPDLPNLGIERLLPGTRIRMLVPALSQVRELIFVTTVGVHQYAFQDPVTGIVYQFTLDELRNSQQIEAVLIAQGADFTPRREPHRRRWSSSGSRTNTA